MKAFEHKVEGVTIRTSDEVIAAAMRMDRRSREGWDVVSSTPMAMVGGSAQLVTVYRRELTPTPVKKPAVNENTEKTVK